MRSDLTIVLLSLALLTFGGCAMPRTVAPDSAIDLCADELDYWDALAARRVVTNHDAVFGLLLLAGDEPPDGYTARIESAREHGWITSRTEPVANESAPLGLIAVAICEALDLPGGVSMRLLGRSPRACTRELIYLDLIPPRTENQSLSGLEFIDLVARVEAFAEEEPDS